AFPVTYFGGSATPPAGVFTAVSAGHGFAIAIRDDGTLVGFGNNNLGQINVPSGTFSEIACGYSFSVGLRTDGTLVEWGDWAYGLHSVPSGQYESISAGAWANNAYAIGAIPEPASLGILGLGIIAAMVRRKNVRG
ncbi:MAG: PEP-CTERM sorting domain-containing protein, partial [Phycisphaerae bacterium]